MKITNVSTIINKQRFLNKIMLYEKRSPFIIIVIAALVGASTGFLGSLFQLGVIWVSSLRINITYDMFSNTYFHYLWAFFIAAVMGGIAYYLVKKFAPETSGSGIPEIEGALSDLRPVRWHRVLPVKFFAGFGALGSGMVLGREGPTVQMGANLGQMLSKLFRVEDNTLRHALLATGAGAGITTAFNAPLGGILFVIEEMREDFTFTLASIKAVFVGAVCACIVYRLMLGSASIFDFGGFSDIPAQSLWIYIILGIAFGLIGVLSNQCILSLRQIFERFYQKKSYFFMLTGAILAGIFGVLSLVTPDITGGGFDLIPKAVEGVYALWPLCLIFIARFIATVLCFSSGAPGGIFSPTLALGTIFGVLFGLVVQPIFPEYSIQLSACAVIGMAGLFAATIRAPLTGMIIVMEMSNGFSLILPLLITCVSATFIAQTLGGKPLYAAILQNLLRSQK